MDGYVKVSDVINIIVGERLRNKKDLPKEYMLARVQEAVERLQKIEIYGDLEDNLNKLEDYLFEKYCVEGDAEVDKIVKGTSKWRKFEYSVKEEI